MKASSGSSKAGHPIESTGPHGIEASSLLRAADIPCPHDFGQQRLHALKQVFKASPRLPLRLSRQSTGSGASCVGPVVSPVQYPGLPGCTLRPPKSEPLPSQARKDVQA
jgi:hypothetical protein